MLQVATSTRVVLVACKEAAEPTEASNRDNDCFAHTVRLHTLRLHLRTHVFLSAVGTANRRMLRALS